MGFDISKLEAQSETITVNGQDIKVSPLELPELMDFMKLADGKDIEKATTFLTYNVLRKNIPISNEETGEGMSNDELSTFIKTKLNSKALLKIVASIRKVSGLSEDEDTGDDPKKEEGKE